MIDPENRYFPNNEYSYKDNKISSFGKINVENDTYLEDPTQGNVSRIYSNVDTAGIVSSVPPQIIELDKTINYQQLNQPEILHGSGRNDVKQNVASQVINNYFDIPGEKSEYVNNYHFGSRCFLPVTETIYTSQPSKQKDPKGYASVENTG
jgi:hypothetical protein